MAIKIPFVADVARFLAGTRDMEDALEDVSDALDDLGDSDAGDAERDLENIGDAAQDSSRRVDELGESLDATGRSTGLERAESDIEAVGDQAAATARRIERSFDDTFRAVRDSGGTATRRVRDDIEETGTAGSRTMQEFGDEARENVAETVASFDGSVSSGVDAIQGTFGGLVSALGPAGMVGAAVVGVGIGLARGLFQKAEERAAALREGIGEIFDELRQNEGTISRAFQTDQIADLLRDTEAFKDLFATDLRGAMQTFGDQFGTIMQGLTGDSEDVAAAQKALAAATQEGIDTWGEYVDENGNVRLGNAELESSLGALNLALEVQSGKVSGGVTANQALAAATAGLTEETEESAEALTDENAAVRENTNLKNAAVTSELDMLDALNAVNDARKENGKSLSKFTEAGRDNLRAIDQARRGIIQYGDALVDNGTASGKATAQMERQERVLIRQVAKAFGITEKQARHYIETLGGIPPAKNTKVTVDDHGTAAATSKRVDNAAKDRDSRISVNADTSSAQADIDRLVHHDYVAKVRVVPVAYPADWQQYRRGERNT